MRRTRPSGGAWVLAAAFASAPLAAHAQGGAARPPPPQVQACITCHGEQGLSQMPNAPNLAGQPSIYLVEQLKAYRSGRRTNEIMSVIARPLSDADIEAAALWYSAIPIEIKR